MTIPRPEPWLVGFWAFMAWSCMPPESLHWPLLIVAVMYGCQDKKASE